jgi:hypothetical protein
MAWLAVTLLVFARFLPGEHVTMFSALDDGWAQGINLAVQRGMVFGRDIIFTYGPFGPVETRLYDPALRPMVIAGASILTLGFATGLQALARPAMAVLVALVLPLVANDALAYAVPLPALLLCARAPQNARLPHGTRRAVLALLPALALLPLAKGSLLIAACLATALLAAMLWRQGSRTLAAGVPAAVLACLLLLWCAAGQQPAALAGYLTNEIPIITGYNSAMATAGPLSHVAAAAMAGAALSGLVLWAHRRTARTTRLLLAGGVAMLLFLVFKAGFVRQDDFHEPITFTALALMALVLAAATQGAAARATALAAVAFLALPHLRQASAAPAALAAELTGAARLLFAPAAFARATAPGRDPVDPLPWRPAGTADIYSSGQARLFATGLPWSPRPVPQSYSAYTPGLAALNLAHLRGPAAPDAIFFRVEPIDHRLPALEDGASWPALLSLYSQAAYDPDSDMALLRRITPPPAPVAPGPALIDTTPAMGATVALPAAPSALWARIEADPSPAGTLAGLVWQAPPLTIRLTFRDGHSQAFRFIPGMAAAGFLLSPFVDSAFAMLGLRAAPGAPAPARQVATLSLIPARSWAWRARYHLAVAPIAFPTQTPPASWQALRTPHPVADTAIPSGGACYADSVNGGAAGPVAVAVTGPTTITGWALFDSGSPGAATELRLEPPSGQAYAVSARAVGRADVAQAFHLAWSERLGFTADPDVSLLPAGRYAVNVVTRRGAVAHECRTGVTLAVVR